ncbi:MAG: rhodanese-like domain-containing protein, partial [Bhargavaea sp.]
ADKEYFIICRSGNRSSMACNFLGGNGYNVTNMTGGMLEWEGETIA